MSCPVKSLKETKGRANNVTSFKVITYKITRKLINESHTRLRKGHAKVASYTAP